MLDDIVRWTRANMVVNNPRVDFWPDAEMVGLRIAMFVGARFCFSGAYNKHFRRIPCILDFVMKPKDMDDTKKSKFFENLWYTLWHSTSFYWAASLFFTQSWRTDLYRGEFHVLFMGWKRQDMGADLHRWYSFEMAFWISSLVYLFLEKARKDFFIMLAHHLATSLLLAGSFLWNYWRIGLCVLLLHDVSDVFLYATKSGKDHLPRAVTEGLFVCLAISYFVLRMMIYPGVCVYTAIRTGYAPFVDPILATLFGAEPFPTDPEMIAAGVGCYSAPILLSVLFVLHCIWFTMIIQVAKKALRTSLHDTGDIRSDSDCSPVSSPVNQCAKPSREIEMKLAPEQGKNILRSRGPDSNTSANKLMAPSRNEKNVRHKKIDDDR
ncbi:unnamed protein product [Amoebophrya sp. A25]|nr:unnamed protein product [Amoebophrya sp. A25]|eukprot:GSA25T00005160001.1